MNPIAKKYKQFKFRDRSKDSVRIMIGVICVYFLLLIDSILDVSIKGYSLHEKLRYAPIVPAVVQILLLFEVHRYNKSFEKEEKIKENAEKYYVEEVKSGWVNVDVTSYSDYLREKLYLAYPLAEWTPKWERIK
jgi:hypothetical protein